MKKEKNELQELCREYLKYGEQKDVAKETGKSYKTVRAVIEGKFVNVKIIDALIARAYANYQHELTNKSKVKKMLNGIKKSY